MQHKSKSRGELFLACSIDTKYGGQYDEFSSWSLLHNSLEKTIKVKQQLESVIIQIWVTLRWKSRHRIEGEISPKQGLRRAVWGLIGLIL